TEKNDADVQKRRAQRRTFEFFQRVQHAHRQRRQPDQKNIRKYHAREPDRQREFFRVLGVKETRRQERHDLRSEQDPREGQQKQDQGKREKKSRNQAPEIIRLLLFALGHHRNEGGIGGALPHK